MTFSSRSLDLARAIIQRCTDQNITLATAESCTGGLISGCLTEIPGSSAVFDRGFVVYSNRAKQDLLNVPADLIERAGAVSEQVAMAMANGARDRAGVVLAVAVTGVAGPGGGTATKPVGLVHMALALSDRTVHWSATFQGDRQAVRLSALDNVLCRIRTTIA